jgi:hypothetical protein
MLCMHREDCDNSIFDNAICLDVPRDTGRRRYSERYVLIEGVFDSKRHGHLGAYPGTIDVRRLMLWGTSRDKPKR